MKISKIYFKTNKKNIFSLLIILDDLKYNFAYILESLSHIYPLKALTMNLKFFLFFIRIFITYISDSMSIFFLKKNKMKTRIINLKK